MAWLSPGMTAGEDHSELAVPDLMLEEYLVHCIGGRPFRFQKAVHVCRKLAKVTFSFHHIDRLSFGNDHEPAGRVIGNATKSPGLQRFVDGILKYVLGELEVMQAEQAGQNGDHPSRFLTEKMVDQDPCVLLWEGHGLWHGFQSANLELKRAQEGALFGQLYCFLAVIGIDDHVTGDHFLGFDKGAVRVNFGLAGQQVGIAVFQWCAGNIASVEHFLDPFPEQGQTLLHLFGRCGGMIATSYNDQELIHKKCF
jgi:hypothetical protein